jgi:ADP-ribose pyrophosphatase YjhB (NUDIX family)
MDQIIDNKKKYNNNNLYKNNLCGNCGQVGHKYKCCNEPITSLGIMLVKLDNSDAMTYEQIKDTFEGYDVPIDVQKISKGIRCFNTSEMNMFSLNRDKLRFLMIQRKHTLGYSEFIRGRYRPDNVDGIGFLFQQMTQNEIDKIGKLTFDELWDDFWMDPSKKKNFVDEYEQSKENFNMLKTNDGDMLDLNLNFYITHITPTWQTAESCFPKGRRNIKEENIECAKREFREESGISEDKYMLLDKIFKPLQEDFLGTDGKRYRHIYYIAITYDDIVPSLDNTNFQQSVEIGNIGFYSYAEALDIIRPYHHERKKLLTQVYMYLMNKFLNKSEDYVC